MTLLDRRSRSAGGALRKDLAAEAGPRELVNPVNLLAASDD
jgi:hypothetical protein